MPETAKKKATRKKRTRKKRTKKAGNRKSASLPRPFAEFVSVAELTADPANVRLHPDANIDAIKGSLTRFGQQKPIVVDSRGVVVAGNGTLAALRALEIDEVWIVRTELEGVEAVAFAIADNRTSDLAAWDKRALLRTLNALELEGVGLEGIGFTKADAARLLASIDPDPPGEFSPVGGGVPEYRCPRCQYEWDGKQRPEVAASGAEGEGGNGSG